MNTTAFECQKLNSLVSERLLEEYQKTISHPTLVVCQGINEGLENIIFNSATSSLVVKLKIKTSLVITINFLAGRDNFWKTIPHLYPDRVLARIAAISTKEIKQSQKRSLKNDYRHQLNSVLDGIFPLPSRKSLIFS